MSDEVVCEPPDIQYLNNLFKALYLFLSLCSHKTPPPCHVTTLATHRTPLCHVTTWETTRHHHPVMSLPWEPSRYHHHPVMSLRWDPTRHHLSCHYPGTPQDTTSLSCHYPGNPQDTTCHVTTLGPHNTTLSCHYLGTHKTPPCHVTTWDPTKHHPVMSLPWDPTRHHQCVMAAVRKAWQVWRERRNSLLCNEP